MQRLKCPPILLACLLAALVVAVFAPAVGNGFVNYDDEVYVTRNPRVASGLALESAEWALTTFDASNWHPLTWLSLATDAHFSALAPWTYHLTNVFLHAAASGMILVALQRMSKATWCSALTAGLFAFHPLRVESVTWVAERKDVLSGFFFAIALFTYADYVRARSGWCYGKLLGVAALGLAAKPMLVTLPGILLLLDYWPLHRWEVGDRDGLRRSLLEKIPLMALSIGCSILTLGAQEEGGAVASAIHFPLVWRMTNAIVAYRRYLGLTLMPEELSPFYPMARTGWPTGLWLADLALLLGVTGGAVLLARRRPYLLVGWLWYLLMLLPVIGIIQVGDQALADRYTYLPQMGVFIAASWGLADLGSACRVPRLVPAAFGSALVLACLVGTRARIRVWHDSETLWQDALRADPDNYMAHYSLALALRRKGDVGGAIAHYERSLASDPDFPEARHNLGIAYLQRDRPEDAIQQFRVALKLDPRRATTWHDLGAALSMRGQDAEAIDCYRRAVAGRPLVAAYHADLAYSLWRTDARGEAASEYREAMRDEEWLPRAQRTAWSFATSPDAGHRHGAWAVRLAEQARQASAHERADLLDTLAAAYAEAGRFHDACQTARAALRLAASDHSRGIASRLELYESGQPFHETAPSGHPSERSP